LLRLPPIYSILYAASLPYAASLLPAIYLTVTHNCRRYERIGTVTFTQPAAAAVGTSGQSGSAASRMLEAQLSVEPTMATGGAGVVFHNGRRSVPSYAGCPKGTYVSITV
jgi:hypothetical protein